MDNGIDSQPVSKKRNRRNRGRGKKQNKKNISEEQNVRQGSSADQPQNVKQNKDAGKKKRNRKKKGWVRDDRYYGRFHCKICQRHWDSSKVYTVGGTKKVKYRQRCQNCVGEDAWYFPYRLELLKCSECGGEVCSCLCEDCGKLKHKRYINRYDKDRKVNPNFEYCTCEKGKDDAVGLNIDKKKPHRSDLCEKCLKGYPCSSSKGYFENDTDPADNEP